MNRLLTSLTARCSRLSISTAQFSNISSNIAPGMPPPPRSSTINPIEAPAVGPSNITPVECPALDNALRIYTFPTAERSPVLAPAPFLQTILEKCDPLPEKPKVEAPPSTAPNAMWAAPRLLTIRRKKMKKHKRRRRYDRDFFKYAKYHREKKLKAEREFIRRMKAHLAELDSFNPENYVEKTIASAKKEWQDELAPTGRKLYPHWSRLMPLEELYGLPKSEYIDKRAGLANEEDRERIKQLKRDYAVKFLGKNPEQ